MASQPFDYVSGLGALPDPSRAFNDAAANRIGLQRGELQNQLIGAQVQQQQAEAAQAAEYQSDVAAAMANPTARSYADLFAKHPQFKDAISKSWETRDAAAKQGDLSALGGIHMALRNGKPEIAAAALERRIAAEKEAGRDTAEDEQILAAIKSGDKGDLAAATGMTGAALAAIVGPEQYAKALGEVSEGEKSFTLAPGSKRYSADGRVIAEAPFAPQYRSVGEGDTLVEVGGGDPASSGSSAGRYTGGWTPRERNGGDNPDAAVDNKITGVARILGVDPGADISGKSPLEIAKALGYGEGGAGSLADRNNNPTNLRVPGSAEYRKFADKDTALKAAAAQVARNLKRGQTTVRSMIEGLPAGGGASTGGARVVAQGAPKADKEREAPSGFRWQGDALTFIPGGPADPSRKNTGGNGGPKLTEQQAKDGFGARRMANASKVLQKLEVDKDFNPNWAGVGSTITKWTGGTINNSKSRQYQAAKGEWADALIRLTTGAAATAGELASIDTTYFPQIGDDSAVLAQKRQQRGVAMAGAIQRAGPGAPPAESGPVRVKSVQQARSLPPGTLFIDPNGVTRRR